MLRLSTDLWQYVFTLLDNPADLLRVAQVSKDFYSMARCNTVWHNHKDRVTKTIPSLCGLFNKYGQRETIDDGKYVRPTIKKQKVKQWVTPKGIWFVFARYLSFKNIGQILSRKKSRDYILDALCYANINVINIYAIGNHSHPKLGEYRFQRCIHLRSFEGHVLEYIWLCIHKYSSKICLYRANGSLINSYPAQTLIRNLQFIIYNKPFNYLLI